MQAGDLIRSLLVGGIVEHFANTYVIRRTYLVLATTDDDFYL